MLYLRFQESKKIEHNSYYIDLANIYNLLDIYETEEVFERHKTSLNLRQNISAKELFNQVLECKKNNDFNKVIEMSHKYKMNGVFAYELNNAMKEYSLYDTDEIMKYMYRNRDLIADIQTNTNYLILFEGDLIHDFKSHGCLVKMNKIIKIKGSNL